MSGHSKFANIKHKKEKNDAKKGKIFTKLGREIMVAVKEGGPDVNNNSKLRDIVAKAKSNNMPNDTIERSIKKASGNLEGVNYEQITYEGYGPEGVAIIVDCLTENKNRTAANVRFAFSKFGGNLGTSGCVSYLFENKGQIIIEKSDEIDEDELFMLVTENGAIDMINNDEFYEVVSEVADFASLNKAVTEAGIATVSAELTYLPTTTTAVSEENEKSIESLLDMLEDDDDVQNVYTNLE